MDSRRDRGGPGPVPTWLEIQGLSEDSLRAAVTGLGIEILGALCARAEPPTVRVRLCSLSARTFTYTMYVELCRYMESCRAGRGSVRTVVPGRGTETRGPDVRRIKIKDEHLGLEDGRNPEDGFNNHARSLHSGKGPYIHNTRNTPQACSVCGEEFGDSSKLKIHMRSHTGEHLFTCKFCGKAYTTSSTLNNHTRIHTGERPYKCTVCAKAFRLLSTLKIHKYIHNGVRPYACKVCAKVLSSSWALKRHASCHTQKKEKHHLGENPYKCCVCNKVFARAVNLSQHNKIHSGEKPYKCSACSRVFARSVNLSKHKRIHTCEKPYQCSVCRKVFIHSSTFHQHQMIHVGVNYQEKNYPYSVFS